ncbi:hypothetical protein LY10_01320 [Planktotalea frisia]|jgi:hypothetical protein|uniref:Uncharacterized protein n=1 Tax=Planktotalea frisia TaxID=696762 RepID=A0A1L9P084_9RHOB|nr:DUF5665 domain-containing protein [Planktotalea frisia]OJI94891.1 hypothetical protein PFRI_09230 [Planktotalea frisia]PZX31376.1 hypothetical protein LY10_01320 [Planktotalea frisia]
MNDDTDARLDKLTAELETLNSHRFIRVHNSLWRLILFQFTRGLAFGLGSVLGASILVSLVVWWLSQFEFIPIIGDFARQLIEWIEIPISNARER